MKHRRIFSLSLVFIIILSSVFPQWTAAENLLFGDLIGPGTFFEETTTLTNSGWSDVFITRSDLTTEGLELTALVNNPVRIPKDVKYLAKQENAYAAINGSFFAWNDEGVTNIGPLVKNGQLYSCANSFNNSKDTFASVYIEKGSKEIKMGYFHPYMFLEREDGKTLRVNRFNINFNGNVSVYNNLYSDKSPGTKNFDDTVEIVVEEGKMKSLRIEKGPVTIPENGFVVSAAKGKAGALVELFKKDASLTFEAYVDPLPATPKPTNTPKPSQDLEPTATTEPVNTPEPTNKPLSLSKDTLTSANFPLKFSDLKMCVPGGGLLVSDGKPLTKFSHIPTGSNEKSLHPRTALGVSKDSNTLFMVTIDGRSDRSVGISMLDLASYMKRLGAHYAINMDGGGSSTMVTRQIGSNDYVIRNNPSGGNARNVSSGIGLVYLADPKSTPNPNPTVIKVNFPDKIFINKKHTIKLKAWDSLLNPLKVKDSEITWSIKGIKHSLKNNVLTPKSTGIATVTASYKDLTASTQVRVIDKPVELMFNKSVMKVLPSSQHSLKIRALSADGFVKGIKNSEIKYSTNVGNIKNKKLVINKKAKFGYITAKYQKIKKSIPVTVRRQKSKNIDKFSRNRFRLKKVNAKACLYIKNSLTLEYDYNNQATSEIIVSYKNGGLNIPKKSKSLSLNITSPHAGVSDLTLELISSEGQTFSLTQHIDWEGKKNVSFALPSTKEKLKITGFVLSKISTSSLDDPETMKGSLTLKNLKAIWFLYPSVKKVKLPKSNKFKDSAWKSSSKKPSKAFVSVATSNDVSSDILKKVKKKYKNRVKKHNARGFIINDSTKSYIKRNYKNTRVIILDTSKGGIVAHSKGQWNFFVDALHSAGKRHLLIVLNTPPENWKNKSEVQLFNQELLNYYDNKKKFANIIAPASKKDGTITNGVRRVSVPIFKDTNSKKIKGTYLLFNVYKKKVNYSFKSL